LEDALHLLGVRNQFAIVTALREKMFRMGFLKISATDFITRDLRRNGQNRHPTAVRIIEAIDQMEIAGSATSGADSQASGEMRLRAGGKCGRFFVSQMNPPNFFLLSNRFGNRVERVSSDSVNSFHARFRESF